MLRCLAVACVLTLVASPSWAQDVFGFDSRQPVTFTEGWQAFTNLRFLGSSLLTLVLAAILGGVVGYHPRHIQCADTLQELEAPKVYILCSIIGAIIGILVTNYGLVVGFIVFGIGGILRFRTILRSASLTGHVIFVTLIGLSCGLNLPHIAVLSTAFGFVLIYILELRTTFRIDVRGLRAECIGEAALAYRTVLEQQGCRVVSEKKNPAKERIIFIFQTPRRCDRKHIEYLLETRVDPLLKGSIDWEVD